uniref:Disease resistance protein RGA3 n=1 Tax=Populus alba TaxID=43335 RepID=A0A4U5M4D5_POPAL|nr:hypothetical protein D5086_0000323150 [Populus alba]
MAAELLLTFALEETLKRVSSIAAEGIGLAWGLEGQLRKLNQSLTKIKGVLQDAARRAVTDESVKRWLQNLQDVAYDAEDVLDEFAYEILRKDQKKGKVRDWFSLHNPVAFRLIMGQKVKKINEALDEIRKDAAGFGPGLTSLPLDRAQEVSGDPDRETHSFLDSSEVVGREDDVSKVMELLTSLTKHQHVLPVVPIVGMAGLGKTTVAKKVCEVVRERKHFDITIWVCVSNDFSKGRILGEMLQNVDETTSRLSNLNAIMENLKKKLEKRTFFLVLDDVWNEDLDNWDDLKEQLLEINSMKGNGVVVTTRKKQVADMMETSPEGSAVDGASHIRHLNLVSRGDDEAALTAVDAKKLRTVFSMVDVLNGPWKFKSLRTLKLRRSDITELPDSICKLRHLRYLDVSRTSIGALPESITELYHLETLRFTDCYSMQKLPKKMRNLVSLRHLQFDDPKLVPAEVRLLTRLQTLPIFAVGPDHMVEELGCLKELRGALKICKLEQVRDREEAEKAELSGKRMTKLVFEWSDDEGNSSVNSEDVLEGLQPHPDIRSLTIEGYGGENFSSWILQLNNLTVLRLKGCSKLRQLPALGCLPRLKILEMNGMPNVKCIGNEFYSSRDSAGVLFPALQILTLYWMDGLEEWMVPGGEVVAVFPCLEELSIKYCGKLRQLPTLGCLPRLKILEMSEMPNVKCIGNEFYNSRDSAGVLFPALQILTLSMMDGLEEWMVPGGEVVAVFPCLEELSIKACGKLKSIPICRLSSLVEFEIDSCDELRYLSGEFHGFTSLRVLSIWWCPKLASIPSVQHCTALVELFIYWCGELISIPGDFRDLNSLKELIVDGCKMGALPSGLQCCASLEVLLINDWSELISIDWLGGLRQLRSLIFLQITACPSLRDIQDDWLGGLTQLQELIIGGFSKEMEAFPVGVLNSIQHLNLSGSLKSLYIHGWDKLKSVPHHLQHLTALEELGI